MTRSRWALALVACAALTLAACASSNPPKKKKNSTSTTHSSTSSTTSSTTTTSTSASSTSSTVASAACTHVSGVGNLGQGAAGTITGTVTVTNTGAATCTVNGYPTLALYSGSGAPLTVTMVNGLSVDVSPQADAAPTTVTIAAGGKAQFAYQFSDVPVGNETSCPTSETASATLPGSSTPTPQFALAVDPCGNGTIRVSPIYATT